MDFYWESFTMDGYQPPFGSVKYPARVCDADDIGQKLFDQGTLFICPPREGMILESQMTRFPFTSFGFIINKKEKDGETINQKFVEDLILAAYQM